MGWRGGTGSRSHGPGAKLGACSRQVWSPCLGLLLKIHLLPFLLPASLLFSKASVFPRRHMGVILVASMMGGTGRRGPRVLKSCSGHIRVSQPRLSHDPHYLQISQKRKKKPHHFIIIWAENLFLFYIKTESNSFPNFILFLPWIIQEYEYHANQENIVFVSFGIFPRVDDQFTKYSQQPDGWQNSSSRTAPQITCPSHSWWFITQAPDFSSDTVSPDTL